MWTQSRIYVQRNLQRDEFEVTVHRNIRSRNRVDYVSISTHASNYNISLTAITMYSSTAMYLI